MDWNSVTIRIETVVKALTYAIGLLAFIAVAQPVGPAYAAGFLVQCGISLVFERQGVFRLPRWMLNFLGVGIVAVTLFRISLADPVTPALQALLMILGIKYLEEKTFRDYMQIYLLAIFLLAGSSLVSLDMSFLGTLVLLMYLLSTSIVLLTYYAQDRALEFSGVLLRRIIAYSLLIPTIAIPLSILFFSFLPRTNLPLLNFLNRGAATTGFSEEMALGDVSSIQEDASFIFRAVMPQVDVADLYWRGIVLDTFDGRRWTRSSVQNPGGPGRQPAGKSIAQTIYLEPYQNRYLFGLDAPVGVTMRQAVMAHDRTVTVPRPVVARLRYEIASVAAGTLPAVAGGVDRYSALPERDWRRIRTLIKSVTGMKKGADAADALLRYLRDSGTYTYSLTALPVAAEPVESFLFESRTGNCEFFASALAVMLRLERIPARIVAGYRGGYYNEMAGYYAVAQKSAHVWVEAYFEGRGWVRLDPTPVSSDAFSTAQQRNLTLKMRMLADTANYYWNAFVITYDFEKQVRLFQTIAAQTRSINLQNLISRQTAVVLVALLAGGAVSVMLILAIRRRGLPEQRILAAFLAELARRGYQKQEGESLANVIARIEQDDLRSEALQFLARFQRHYYRDEAFDRVILHELKGIIENIKQIQ